MGQLTITLPDELETKAREYARDYDSVSDFVRELILRATGPTYWDRVSLVLLLEIKRAMGENVSEESIDAIRSGYSRHYPNIVEAEMPTEEMELVHDVLGMYAHLQYSYEHSKERDSDIENEVQFPGFDGNADDGHYGYLCYLLKHDMYTHVKPLDKGIPINSHMSVTGTYDRMLAKYRDLKGNHSESELLTLDEIRSILAASTSRAEK